MRAVSYPEMARAWICTEDKGEGKPACDLPKKTSQGSVRMGKEPVSLGIPSTISVYSNTQSLFWESNICPLP